MDKIDKIRKELERRIEAGTKAYSVAPSSAIGGILQAYENILSFINSLPEDPVNIDFEKELYKQFGQVKDFTLGMRIAKYFYEIGHKEEPVSETNKVVQVRRCLEEVATTINPFVDEVVEQFNLKDKSIVAKEIQYRGVGLKGDFGENIHRSDDEVIYILKEDKTVGLIVIRRTEFNNAEITMVKTEERFKEKSND